MTVRKAGRVLVALGAAMAIVLALQLTALARAGGGTGGGGGGHSGGGGYSSGGSHSGGGFFFVGGSGSGGGGVSALFFFLIVGLIGAILIWRALASRKSGSTAAGGDDATAPVDAAAVDSGIKALQARDPNFSPQVFIDRAQQTFFVLQNAWMARNLEPARIYLCLLYTSPSPRDLSTSRMPSSA